MPAAIKAKDLRYPIGKFQAPKTVTAVERRQFIEQIAKAPSKLRQAIHGLTDEQLDTAYRPNGWTVRQVMHHVPDSHMNAYIRFKLALTEDEPTIKPYHQDLWAELGDSRSTPVATSLLLLVALHQRWVNLLRGIREADFAKTFRHPEMGLLTLDTTLALYAWHGAHHTAHITALRERKGWK